MIVAVSAVVIASCARMPGEPLMVSKSSLINLISFGA
jgi:hypothetical protein